MKIAVTYENGEIFQHFGHAEQFKIYEVNGKEIVDEKIPQQLLVSMFRKFNK